MSKLAIHWFRQDLRLADNPSLHFAAQNGPITPIFIHDTVNNSQKSLTSVEQALGGSITHLTP